MTREQRPRKRFAAVALAALTTLMCSAATRAGDFDSTEKRLIAVLSRVPQRTLVGLVVADVQSGETRFAREGDLPLKPASVMKLLTTAAALEHLGPGFAFETRFLLSGDELLVLGGGDPGLGDERLAQRRGRPLHYELDEWAAALAARGIRRLRTLALDDSVFDAVGRHPDWPSDQHQAWYQAPVGGLNFNDNCLDSSIRVADGRVTLTLRPDVPESFYTNALRAGGRHEPVVHRESSSDRFEFRGTAARSGDFAPVSVNRPTVFFGYALKLALQRRGITVEGEVVRRKLTPEAVATADLLFVHRTPLTDVLWRCNTFSQNLFAECLMKALSAYELGGARSQTPGTWEAGARVMARRLEELGVNLRAATLRDGSGLSHENRVSAATIVDVLVAMRRGPHRALFVDSLADPGDEGTLSRRFREPGVRDCVVAKTGTIRGVRTLAGYATDAGGETLAFALLANGAPPGDLWESVVEALCAR